MNNFSQALSVNYVKSTMFYNPNDLTVWISSVPVSLDYRGSNVNTKCLKALVVDD